MNAAEEDRLCQAETWPATLVDPPAYCEEEAAPDSDYCPDHDPDAAADRLEEIAEERSRARWD